MKLEKISDFLKKEYAIIFLLFAITILVRIIFKNGGVYHWDSLKDVIVIEEMLRTGEIQYSYAYGAPGMVAFVFLFYWIDNLITGSTSAESAYFFATFLTAGLSIILTYLISKKITKSKIISISSALFMCFNAVFLSVTTYPKTHAMALFFTLSSMYLIFIYNKNKKIWPLLLSGLFFGFSVGVRILNILMFLPILFIYFNPKKKKRVTIKKSKLNIKNFLYFVVPSLIVWFLLFSKKIGESGGFGQYLKSLLTEQGAAVGWQGLFSPSLTTGLNHIYNSITIAGTILLALGLIYGYKKYKKVLIFLAIWILPSLFYFANIRNPEARFFIIILPAISILMGMGIKAIYEKKKLFGILAILIIITSTFATAYPIIQARHEYSGTRGFAEWVGENTEENAIVMSNDLGFFIEYYGKRERIVHPRSGNDEEVEEFIQKLLDFSDEGIPLYSTGEGFAIDPGEKVLNKIRENFNIELIGEKENEVYQFSELELKRYNEQLFRLTPLSE